MKISILASHASHAVLGLVLLPACIPLVHAQDYSVAIESVESIPFMNGGVGKDEQARIRKAGRDFNLRLEFSSREDNEFVVGTDLLITDPQGTAVFALPNAGPMVNVNLPYGQYRVAATYRGQTETRLVTLRRKKGQSLYFHWKRGGRPEPLASLQDGMFAS